MTESVWRKRLKVIGLSLSIMILGLYLFCAMYMASYVHPSGTWSISLAYGRVGFAGHRMNSLGWKCFPIHTRFPELTTQMPWYDFAHTWLGFDLPGMGFGGGYFCIPVWLLVVAVGSPTAFLWWRNRPKGGFCRVCKFDLTGNVSGTCPECGTWT